MDLRSRDIKAASEVPQAVVLLDPKSNYRQPLIGDDEKPVIFYVLGSDSNAATQYRHRRTNEEIGKQSQTGNVDLEDVATKVDSAVVGAIAALTSHWTTNWTLDGQRLTEFTSENAEHIYIEMPWIMRQVQNASAKASAYLGNFSPDSSILPAVDSNSVNLSPVQAGQTFPSSPTSGN